jgi:hypothetical protein
VVVRMMIATRRTDDVFAMIDIGIHAAWRDCIVPFLQNNTYN